MISHPHQCIFIHIPKTGGTSIEKKLGFFDELKPGVQEHKTILEIQKELPPKTFQAYFKFAFVRNPWSRVFAWYRNIMRDTRMLNGFGMSKHWSLPQFVRYRMKGNWAMRPQLYWITDEVGDLAVDWVGKFENLQNDFNQIGERLHLSDSELPHLLYTPVCNYAPFYDAVSRQMVHDLYEREIKQFHYSFEDDVYLSAPFPAAKRYHLHRWGVVEAGFSRMIEVRDHLR